HAVRSTHQHQRRRGEQAHCDQKGRLHVLEQRSHDTLLFRVPLADRNGRLRECIVRDGGPIEHSPVELDRTLTAEEKQSYRGVGESSLFWERSLPTGRKKREAFELAGAAGTVGA